MLVICPSLLCTKMSCFILLLNYEKNCYLPVFSAEAFQHGAWHFHRMLIPAVQLKKQEQAHVHMCMHS